MALNTAIIHEWLVNYAGSERVLEQIVRLHPHADLFCQVDFLEKNDRHFILDKKTTTSFIQNLPGSRKHYRNYLPLMPFAVRQFDVSGYDLIISNSHSVAKGIKKHPGQLQICYCHTPMRYAWDLRGQYLKESDLDTGIKGAVINYVLDRIRAWDLNTAQQVDHFIANSHYIQDRIKRSYGRDSTVIYPPVDVNAFTLHESKDNYFLAASRMVPYKKMDLIVDAFSENALPLVVIGDGPDFEKVKKRAKKNVEFLGFQKDESLIHHMQKARAFVFAAEEDFGILPVEAQACGTPVIAYGKGGVTETVIPLQGSGRNRLVSRVRGQGSAIAGAIHESPPGEITPTGIFFHEQNVPSLNDAIKKFIAAEDSFNPLETRKNAERFSAERFRKAFKNYVDDKVNRFF
jgi:glycosyltransferase involved in cell wall biosynthesis